MNEILGRIGQFNVVEGKPCLAACEDQKNSVSITTSRYVQSTLQKNPLYREKLDTHSNNNYKLY